MSIITGMDLGKRILDALMPGWENNENLDPYDLEIKANAGEKSEIIITHYISEKGREKIIDIMLKNYSLIEKEIRNEEKD